MANPHPQGVRELPQARPRRNHQPLAGQLDTPWPHPSSQKRLTMEWIALKDQMPEEDKMVLLCDHGGYMAVAWLEYGRFFFGSMVWFQHEFTHWMPLPQPPKQ